MKTVAPLQKGSLITPPVAIAGRPTHNPLQLKTATVQNPLWKTAGSQNPLVQLKGNFAVNDDKELENEADKMGTKAFAGNSSAKSPTEANLASPINSNIIQLSKWRWDEANQTWMHVSGSKSNPPPFPGAFDGEMDEDEEAKGKSADKTYGGQRIIGDSGRLAKNRYNRKPKPYDFKKWKKKREAQHLIPASLAKKFKSLVNIIDDANNGMMLPAEYKATNTKVTHRKPKYRDHATYTRNVRKLITTVLGTGMKENQSTMRKIMRRLRPVNRLTTYQYLDDINYTEFKNSWNAKYGVTYPV